MVDINGDTGAIAQPVTKIEGLLEGVEAGAIRCIKRMKWFYGQRNASRAGVGQKCRHAIFHHLACALNIPGALRQPANHHH
ncbi:hypothetical protein D3C80_2069230 [compost metagenome]